MPIYGLTDDPTFPPPELAEPEGLLAIGGDLSEERLLNAYRQGIFPWYSGDSPILWWSPDPRMVLFPDELRMTKSLGRIIKQGKFEVAFDTAFIEVIEGCAAARDDEGTWITPEMMAAYIRLHRSGYAHSVECRLDGKLAGGLYGLSLGGCFFGESMFTRVSNASKVAFAALINFANAHDFVLIDCQVSNPHLESLGAREIPRTEFLDLLDEGLKAETIHGKWEVAGSWRQ